MSTLTPHFATCLRQTGLGIMMSVICSAAMAAGPEPALNFDRVGWQQIRLKFSKLFIRMTIDAELVRLPADGQDLGLIDIAPRAPLNPRGSAVAINLDTGLLNLDSKIQLLLDPGTGRAFQYEVHDRGRRYRHRYFRFTTDGAVVRTSRPDEANLAKEKNQPWQTWGQSDEYFQAFPEGAAGQVITDPIAVLYVAAAAGLVANGPPLELLGLVGRGITRIVLQPRELVTRRVAFELGGRKCKGDVTALRVTLTGAPLNAGDQFEMDFLGLQEDIELFIETGTRLPVEVSGRAPFVGKARVRVKDARLREGLQCPAR